LHKTNIDFIKLRHVFFGISGTLVLIGIISLSIKGVNMGLDFSGGTMIQVNYEKPMEIGTLRAALEAGKVDAGIQSYSAENSYAIKVKGTQESVNETGNKIIAAIKTLPNASFTEEKRDYVGPVVGRDLAKKAMFAMILSMFGIIIYVAFRFSNPVWGTAGVIGLLHDVFVALTAMSITNREIDLVIVAAFLTIAGYSINDTIVIFDRMRENMRNFPKMPLGELINMSVNECLSRTIITTATVFITVLILVLFGGSSINNFAFCMLIGTVTGVYSTIALCTPMVYQWEHGGGRKK
ncbi:MAG: protein translocase subunit SecF, partial [Elusimicrobia bacterium]|nr:protein translocase subunit SecF [Elusimicrobiota bacterium]